METLVVDSSIVDNLRCGVKHTIILSLKAPPVGFFKLNVDGSMLKSGLAGGIGGLLRNNEGKQLATFSELIGQSSPILAELLVLKYGLECPLSYVYLVREIVELILAKNVIMRHIQRVCNVDVVIDVLAKKGYMLLGSRFIVHTAAAFKFNVAQLLFQFYNAGLLIETRKAGTVKES
ncbi:hypothetical protein V6N11_071841 [Hibiscus sabdariffa]|uniref:RNase H type-1 domain-containing protein n=1 Tax=Hibiscus sabdariffa TaxID=183260 RepID=A0ABR2U1I3_9ROSI